MKGLLVTHRKKNSKFPYFGFNGGGGTEIWEDIEKWNQSNLLDQIELIDDICMVENLLAAKKYYGCLIKEKKTIEDISLIYFDENLNQQNFLHEFNFIGYDCGFVNDSGANVFFSSIYNELQREIVNDILMPFKNKLNNFGLFDSVSEAKQFNLARNQAIEFGRIEFIETAFDSFVITKIFLYQSSFIGKKPKLAQV